MPETRAMKILIKGAFRQMYK